MSSLRLARTRGNRPKDRAASPGDVATARGNGVQQAGYKTFQDFMHQKSNYDDWSVLAELKDGQRRGDNYKNGVDAFLEYIAERAPELEPHVRRYGEERFG